MDHVSSALQDPVLFSGSLRSNMDPEGAWPDHKLWEALAAVQLKEAVTKVPLNTCCYGWHVSA